MKTVKAFVWALCAMLMLGTFATAQWQERGRRGYGSPTARAVSDLIAAHDLLRSIPDISAANYGSYMRDMRSSTEAAIDQLQKAMAAAGMDPNRLPPPDPSDRNASKLRRATFLMERADRLLSSGRERDGDLREQASVADGYIRGALNSAYKSLDIVGDSEQQPGHDQRDRGYDERDRRGY